MHTFLAGSLLVMAAACFTRHVETQSQPVQLHVHLTGACADRAEVQAKIDTPVEYATVEATEPARYTLVAPAMGGGYQERGGERSHVHDPATYPVVRIRVDGVIVHDLSTAQIRALPHDTAGYAIVALRCAAS